MHLRGPALLCSLIGLTACAEGSWSGRYSIQTEAKVDVKGTYVRTFRPKVDVSIRPLQEGRLQLTFSLDGYRCELQGSVQPGERFQVSLPAGQRCPLKIDAKDFTATLDSKLEKGRVALKDEKLDFSLRWVVSGTVVQKSNPAHPTSARNATLKVSAHEVAKNDA